MGPILAREVVEICYALFLTTKAGLIRYHQVSRGALSATPVNPREVFQAALLANAASIVLVHNHPSGDVTPSSDDLAIARRIANAGEIIGIELLDSIVVGWDSRYASLREMGCL
jgi:DNA repair protein RadC